MPPFLRKGKCLPLAQGDPRKPLRGIYYILRNIKGWHKVISRFAGPLQKLFFTSLPIFSNCEVGGKTPPDDFTVGDGAHRGEGGAP